MGQVNANYTPSLDPNSFSVDAASVVIATIDDFNIILGADVSLARQTEICAAVDLLRNGLFERGLQSFAGQPIFTCVSIDNITTTNRRTSSSEAGSSFAADDVAVSAGANVTATGKRQMLWQGINDLKFYLVEQLVDDSLAA
jgi:hypothetical protein